MALNSPVVQEALPFAWVHYPNHYGTFLAFSVGPDQAPVICDCAQGAVLNYVALRKIAPHLEYADRRQMADLSAADFTNSIAERSLACPGEPLAVVSFGSRLCHRCNLASPSLRYCVEMYGGTFTQYYGWYTHQAAYRMGVDPRTLNYLPSLCPPEIASEIDACRAMADAAQEERERLTHIELDSDAVGVDRTCVSLWRRVNQEDARHLERIERDAARRRRALQNRFEDVAREDFGMRPIGEGWVSESMLHQIVRRLFPHEEIIRHARPEWLHGLELDIFLPAIRLAFEYQGQQHFHAVDAWGGELALRELQNRDAIKRAICVQRELTLISVDYTEPLTEEHVRTLVEEARR